MKYILSGGGTGGHIYPALAIATELKNRDENNEILYVGKKGSLEEELVTKAGFDFSPIHVEGLPRKALNKQTITSAFALLRGLRDSKKIIKNFKPDVVIGTGGYVCAPIVYKAQKNNIKTVVQEQNAFPGKTNRFLAKNADLVAINFNEAKEYLNSKNIIFTGNPIRNDFKVIDKEKAAKDLNIELDKKIVLSFGGSGGQESTNEAIIEILKNGMNIDFKLIHITGKPHYDYLMDKLKDVKISENVEILNYSHDIPNLLMVSDLVIASSSAMTLAEISAVGLASILIPKAYTAGNHQVFNANSYKEKDAAEVILEENLTGEVLYNKIKEILENDDIRFSMGKNSKKLGNAEAVKNLGDIIERL